MSNFDEAVFLEDACDYVCDGKNVDSTSNSNGVANNNGVMYDEEGEELASDGKRIGKRKKKKRRGVKRGSEEVSESGNEEAPGSVHGGENANDSNRGMEEEVFEEEETSIFGQTVGSSNATWVECDRCKKVRLELRVDQ